jgi:hypothetical protein
MPNIEVAEWILRLVTSQDNAASTVGDLVEEAPAHDIVWFWSAVLRTATSLLWRDVAENPARVTGMGFIGLAVDVVASLLLAGLSGVAFFVAARSGHELRLNSLWWTIGLDAPPLVTSLLIGRMLARLAPGRELARAWRTRSSARSSA